MLTDDDIKKFRARIQGLSDDEYRRLYNGTWIPEYKKEVEKQKKEEKLEGLRKKQAELEANGYKFSSAKSPNSGTVIECPNGEIIQSVVNEWYSGDSLWSAGNIAQENRENAINQAWQRYKDEQ